MAVELGKGSDRSRYWSRWFHSWFYVAKVGPVNSVHSFVVGHLEAVYLQGCPKTRLDPSGFGRACDGVFMSKLGYRHVVMFACLSRKYLFSQCTK